MTVRIDPERFRAVDIPVLRGSYRRLHEQLVSRAAEIDRDLRGEDAEVYKIRIGRSLLLGLEVLVAADIVKTIAHELSFISLGLLAGLVLTILFAVLVFLALLVRRILKENAVPAIDSVKASLDNIRGTTEFAGETVASPIIRTYAVVKGVRAGLGAVTILPGRIKGRKKGRK